MAESFRIHKINLVIIGLYLAFVVVRHVFGIPCLFWYLTGKPCPGCGMTRAMIAAFHLDFAEAFHHHWMFWAMPFVVVCLIMPGRFLHSKIWRGGLVLIGLGFVANWIYHW